MKKVKDLDKKAKKCLRNDFVLVALLVSLSLILLLIMTLTKKEGNFVLVEIDGKTAGEYSLSVNGEYEINGGTNILVVKDGEAFFSYADCPDKTCVKTGKIKFVGQSIICLPNKVTARIVGNNLDGGVDIVS